jgi:hypothetical protein
MIQRTMRYKIFGTSLTAGIALILVMGIALAGVFVVFTYPSTTTPASPTIYLEQGANYTNANALGLVSGGAGPNTEITSGTSIGINGVSGAGYTYILNVFKVVNSSSGIKGPVYLYINGTLPSGVTLYFDNTTAMAFSGTKTETYSVVQGGAPGNGTLTGAGANSPFSAKIPLTKSYTLYISFLVAGTVTGTGTLYLQVSIP